MLDTARLGAVAPVAYTGDARRHQAPGYNPRAGEGARLNGGRFNPPRNFPVLYLCTTRACVVAELERRATLSPIGLEGLLPREVYRYAVDLSDVLDLTDDAVVGSLGLSRAALVGDDWTSCQAVGVAAHGLSFQAILSPSATGVGTVLAVLSENLGTGLLEHELGEVWATVDDMRATDDR